MSKYMKVEVKIDNEEALRAALREWAENTKKVYEDHSDAPVSIRDYFAGQTREQYHYVIRSTQFNSYFDEDIGFQRQVDGSFNVAISTHDQGADSARPIVEEISALHAVHKTIKLAQQHGYTVARRWRDEQTSEHMVQFAGYTN